MFKIKGLGKRIAGIVLAGTMVITLLPQLELVASGVTVDGYPIYNDEIFEAIKADKITNTSVAHRDTVYGGISSWFYLDEESRINRTHVQHCTTYTSTTKVNLGPAMRIYSADNQNWQAQFYSYLDSEIRNNPDVSLKFGATLKATNSKPSMTLGGTTIGGSSLTKKKTTAVEGVLDSPSASLTLTVQGASGTEASGMWVAAIDNSPAEYAGISVRLNGNQLYFDIKMDEELRWANSTADQYKDSMYLEFYLMNSLTNMESACLRANFEKLDGDTLVFCCSNIGKEFANGEFQVTRITKANFPVISNINFAVYGVRSCYDYQISYDKWNKVATYQTVGNNVTYMQDVSLDTTPITDLAGNRVELTTMSLLKENICFDNLDPSIDSIRIEDANGVNRDDAAKIKNNEEANWPADISREEIFLGHEQGINFSVVTTELINKSQASDVTAKLNVQDASGKQITLKAVAFDEEAPGTYGERTKSVIRFETFTAQTGMSMMTGYEGKAIQIVEITGNVLDKAGNRLSSTIPAADKQIFLDAEAPSVTVEKKENPEENSRDLELLVTINDRKENLAAGILGEYASLALTPNKLDDKGYTYKYTYEVLSTDNKELASGTGSMSADKAGVIHWQLHGVDSYAAKVQLHFSDGKDITIDGIQASVSVKDIVGNQNTDAATSLDYLVDELAPVITIQPVDYTYGATNADVSVTFNATDYSKIASVQYQWTDIAATQPVNAWSALEIETGKSIQKTITKNQVGTTASYKLWVQVGDDKGNTALASTEVVVNLDKPSIYYDASAITSEPDYAPQITVIGPAAKSDGTQANTRITVTMGDKVYVRIVKTGETVNVFDFSDSVTWYQVKFNENKTAYTEATQVTDNSVLKNYYGEVRVSFDAAYADLIPAVGAIDKNVTNGSYTSDTAEIKVLYASTTAKAAPTDVHNVTFGEVKDATGSNVLAADGTAGKTAILLKQIAGKDSVIAGTQFAFILSNKLIEDWGITNIDFGRSYVELVYTKGDVTTVIDTELLQNATSQTYTLPASLDYETGMYTIKVYVYQSGSDKAAEYQSLNLVLDAETVQNAGLWEYNIYTHYSWDGRMITHTGDTAPLEMVGISLGDQKEIGRDNTFAYYTAGAYLLNISLQAPNTEAEYDGIKIGEIVGFRMWNSLSNMTETDLASYEFSRDAEVTEDGRVKKDYDILDPVVYEIDEFPQGSAGFIYNDYTNGRELPLVKGINTFYYQVMLSNGTVSEIRQFTFVVSDMAPSMKITVDSFENSLKPSAVAGQFRVKNITMKIEDAYSMNGGGDTYIYLHTNGNTDITRVDGSTEYYSPQSFTEESCQLYVGDKLLFDDDQDNSISYQEGFEEKRDITTLGFIVYDEFGGAMVVAPQMGDEGNKYLIDDTDWKISPFNSSSSYTDTYKDANGNVVTNSTFTKCYLSLKDDAEMKCLPELVDYDSITFTFYKRVEENGEMVVKDSLTVPMVDNYAEPNLAGYMGARRDPYTGEITVYLANLVDEEPTSTWVSYDVNYMDIYGNEYTRYGGYRPYSVSSGVVSAYMTDKGIELYIGAAVAGGLDAQYIGSSGNTSRGLIQTGEFANGIYRVSYTDMFGKLHEYDYEITNGWDFGVDVEYSTLEPTMKDVTVLLKSTSEIPITVVEEAGITIKSNGTTAVEVTASKNVTFGFTMANSNEVRQITVDNIYKFKPTIQWSYDKEQVLRDEKGNEYLYGPVTAYIIDENLDVVDSYTGLEPSYTFYPGEETSYTFKGDSYYAVLGKETTKGSDLTVKLPVELRNESFEVENPELPAGDTDAPAVQLRAYAQRNGVFANEKLALQVEPDKYGEMLNDYEDDTIIECFENRADTTEFLEEIGWASTYRFEIELIDDSDVKLFVKRGLYTNAPNYAIGGSDTINGVSLNGRVLEVTETTEFTLFAVDEQGNATAIPFNVTNVGKAPVPQVKTIYAGTQAFVYVLPPEVANASDVADFKLTGPTGVAIESDVNSEYYGKWYMSYKQNGTYQLDYSYTYKDKEIIGVLEVVIDEIDNVQILSEIIKWSANKSKVATNQDVTVQLTFNKNVKEVVVPYEFKDKVDVLITGSRVTVRYEENLDAILPITAVAYNDTHITFELDAVTNIDKVAPVVTQPVITLADNGKSATVTITTDEDALFGEENCYGTKVDNAYVYKTTVKENGDYAYKFMDKAGNITQITFTVDEIVDTALELLFNTTASDAGAVADPSDFTLRVGDTIYVKANRASKISLNNGTAKDVAANTWQAFVITENEVGLWPIVFAIDAYGNTDSALLGGVKALDKDAPVITLIKDCVYAKTGTDSADVLALLKANMTVSDADANVTVEIDFTDKLTVEGTTAVTYTAKDSFGNVSTKIGWLRLTAASEPEVKVDGEAVGRDSVYLGKLADELNLSVDTDGEPYSIVFKKGVYTTAQMKIGATVLVRDAETVTSTELPFTEAGYYTICIRTQSRDEYLFIVYVD